MPTTTHTPSGEFPRSEPVHSLNLDSAADQLVAKLPGSRRQTRNLAREAGVSVVMMAMEAGDTINEHSAPGAVALQALRGHMLFTAEGGTVDMRPGDFVLLQPGVRHDIRAEEQSVILLSVTGGA